MMMTDDVVSKNLFLAPIMPKRKPQASSRAEILKRAASTANYTMKHPILKATFQFTTDGRAWAKADTSVVVERYGLQVIDELLDGTSTPKPPNRCEEKGCTNPATYAFKNSKAKARMCASHKLEAMVIVGCSKCSQNAAVTVNGVVVCLAHAAIEVGKLQATDPIVDVRGTYMCACGAVAWFGLENKRRLACGTCARVWGVLLGGVAFAYVGVTGSPPWTANACVGAACAEKAKKPVGNNITPSGKRYCAKDRDAVITDEAAKDKPFDERTTFKFAPLPCQGKPCTADGCAGESVVVRAADDTAMCLAHWTALDDVEAKKAFEWTGACYKSAMYGPTFDDGNVRGPRERCGDHKLADDVNNHSSRCSVCVAALGWRWATIARGKCAPCNGGKCNADQWFPLMRQSLWIGFWQRNVSLAGATITHESREKLLEEDKLWRIDTRVDRADGTVDLIEIDEGAHWARSVCEELGRLRAVVQIPGKQVRVVRVNPDRPGKQIAAKITRGAVVRLLEEKGGQLTFDDKLAMEEVKKENLERSARLVEEARNVPPGHVVYVDYPLKSPHLMVNGRALVGHSDVQIRGADGKYADLIVVPLQLFFGRVERAPCDM
jgi:hypothetical protein